MPTKVIWVRSQYGFRPVVVPAGFNAVPSGGTAFIPNGLPLVQGSNVLYDAVP
jgi:formylmethanofuran dehydrogenase subunit D